MGIRQAAMAGDDSETSYSAGPQSGPDWQGWLAHNAAHLLDVFAHGTSLAVQKELLRHSDISTTTNIYTQALSEEKRQAASAVMDELLGRNRLLVPVCTRRDAVLLLSPS